MKSAVQLKTAILFTLITLALVCFVLSPRAQAVTPAPDGGYAGGNTAEGQAALLSLTTGGYNTAVGFFSLRSDTTTSFNTAIGAGALFASTGAENTATGAGALFRNTTGGLNTANGAFALFSNTTGPVNTANGAFALFSNTAGTRNTANGESALYSNTTGVENTATGFLALGDNSTGSGNTAIGKEALDSNTTGFNNTAVGLNAGSITTTGTSNIYIGDMGNDINPGESNTIAIGNNPASGTSYNQFFVGAVYGVTTGSSTTLSVIVDQNGQLGTAPSAARFKREIKPMDKASDSVLALKPVTFHYKSDKTNTPQFGLVAEEVAKVNPDLVVRDKNGEIYTVRYDAVNAMLLNEFLKEHKAFVEEQRKVQELEANATEQEKQLKALATTVEEQASQIQKVSAQLATGRVRVAVATGLEASKFATGRIRSGGPAPETVLTSR